jgi:hypothetical protein
MGMATPTVAPLCGVMESSSSGGPEGWVGEGLLLGLEAVPPPAAPLAVAWLLGEWSALDADALPPQPLAVASTAPASSATPMPFLNFRTASLHLRLHVT